MASTVRASPDRIIEEIVVFTKDTDVEETAVGAEDDGDEMDVSTSPTFRPESLALPTSEARSGKRSEPQWVSHW